MQSFKLFYLEEMNRRAFINSLISAGTGIANASKLAAAVPPVLKNCLVEVDSDFNILNIAPWNGDSNPAISLSRNVSIDPDSIMFPLNGLTLKVTNFPESIITALKANPHSNARDIFKPLIKPAYIAAFQSPAYLDSLEGLSSDLSGSGSDEIQDVLDSLEPEMDRYEEVTGQKLPKKVKQAFSDAEDACFEELDAAREDEAERGDGEDEEEEWKEPPKFSAGPVKFSAHHHTLAKFNPASQDDEPRTVRGIGESVHK